MRTKLSQMYSASQFNAYTDPHADTHHTHKHICIAQILLESIKRMHKNREEKKIIHFNTCKTRKMIEIIQLITTLNPTNTPRSAAAAASAADTPSVCASSSQIFFDF